MPVWIPRCRPTPRPRAAAAFPAAASRCARRPIPCTRTLAENRACTRDTPSPYEPDDILLGAAAEFGNRRQIRPASPPYVTGISTSVRQRLDAARIIGQSCRSSCRIVAPICDDATDRSEPPRRCSVGTTSRTPRSRRGLERPRRCATQCAFTIGSIVSSNTIGQTRIAHRDDTVASGSCASACKRLLMDAAESAVRHEHDEIAFFPLSARSS